MFDKPLLRLRSGHPITRVRCIRGRKSILGRTALARPSNVHGWIMLQFDNRGGETNPNPLAFGWHAMRANRFVEDV